MITKASIRQFGDNLYLVSLPVAYPGFDAFIGSWIYTGNPAVIIDVGPSATTHLLLEALAVIGLRQPDLILLTHIHIDHGGGIGAVARAFPHCPVVCHPKGVNHIIDPQRLWEGSLKTLGELARRYGAMEPVPANQVMASSDLQRAGVTAVETPGHAPHHTSYVVNDLLFAGEAGGVCQSLPDGRIYMRPATPPRFFLETSLASIDRLLDLSPDAICYGHVGMQSNGVQMLRTHRDQLERWLSMIAPLHAAAGEDRNAAQEACRDYLLANDPLMAGFTELSADVQAREHNFLMNSVRGFWGYLDGF
jgi:glyoxylase-like metal-dependent hydrolase (beta-lactamase superfamily II)